jgi:hypothetical protein
MRCTPANMLPVLFHDGSQLLVKLAPQARHVCGTICSARDSSRTSIACRPQRVCDNPAEALDTAYATLRSCLHLSGVTTLSLHVTQSGSHGARSQSLDYKGTRSMAGSHCVDIRRVSFRGDASASGRRALREQGRSRSTGVPKQHHADRDSTGPRAHLKPPQALLSTQKCLIVCKVACILSIRMPHSATVADGRPSSAGIDHQIAPFRSACRAAARKDIDR